MLTVTSGWLADGPGADVLLALVFLGAAEFLIRFTPGDSGLDIDLVLTPESWLEYC